MNDKSATFWAALQHAIGDAQQNDTRLLFTTAGANNYSGKIEEFTEGYIVLSMNSGAGRTRTVTLDVASIEAFEIIEAVATEGGGRTVISRALDADEEARRWRENPGPYTVVDERAVTQ
jgi:hypothetical protein